MSNELIYGAYILIWPVLTLGVLVVICRAVVQDSRRARASNEGLL